VPREVLVIAACVGDMEWPSFGDRDAALPPLLAMLRDVDDAGMAAEKRLYHCVEVARQILIDALNASRFPELATRLVKAIEPRDAVGTHLDVLGVAWVAGEIADMFRTGKVVVFERVKRTDDTPPHPRIDTAWTAALHVHAITSPAIQAFRTDDFEVATDRISATVRETIRALTEVHPDDITYYPALLALFRALCAIRE
jgi:hypothetical protein